MHSNAVAQGMRLPIRRAVDPGRRALLFRTDAQSKRLEVKSQRKLQIALAAANSSPFGKHFPEGVEIGGIESDITCVRVTPATATPIRMVDKVEGFSPELEPSLLVDGEVLEQAEIPVLVSGLIDEVSVERTRSGLGKNRRTGGIGGS